MSVNLVGNQSIRITEKRYPPRVKARQEQLKADVRRAWLKKNLQLEVHGGYAPMLLNDSRIFWRLISRVLSGSCSRFVGVNSPYETKIWEHYTRDEDSAVNF